MVSEGWLIEPSEVGNLQQAEQRTMLEQVQLWRPIYTQTTGEVVADQYQKGEEVKCGVKLDVAERDASGAPHHLPGTTGTVRFPIGTLVCPETRLLLLWWRALLLPEEDRTLWSVVGQPVNGLAALRARIQYVGKGARWV